MTGSGAVAGRAKRVRGPLGKLRVFGAMGLCLLLSPRAQASAPRGADEPNSAPQPFLPAPQGQVQTRAQPQVPILAPQYAQQRRFALTLSPVVGRLKIPLSGRSLSPVGFGYHLEGEVALRPWLWVAVGWQRLHYLAYAESQPKPDSTEVVPLSSKGWIRWQDLSLGLRYAIDDGRVRPILEGGASWTSLKQPTGVASGQSAQACTETKGCDAGLTCIENTCQPAAFLSAYVGVEAQWLIRRHFSVGIAARYFVSLISGQGTQFPSLWTVALRASLRY